MSNSKKIISLLLSVIMIMSVFTIVPFSAGAAEAEAAETGEESGTTGDCTWKIEGTKLTISGNGKMRDYDSTEKNDSWVTTAPWGNYSFNTVVIESGVTSIGSNAFRGCTGLTSVTIGNSVTSIGERAFYDCTKLTSIDIPDSVTSIGSLAFEYCRGLTSVTIPDSVTSIGCWAFEYTAWYNNQPYGLVYAGKVAYEMKGTCPSEVVIKDGTLGIAGTAFFNCSRLTSIDIPDSVTSIGRDAFSRCTGLTSVTIGNSVTSIGYGAFYNTSWYNNQPDGLVYAGKVAYKMKGSCPSEVVIKDGTLGIADSAFDGCTGLTSIDIPDSVTSIGDYAFRECTGLTSITIPDSVTNIGNWAFSECTGLTSITIPGSVTSIGDEALGYYLGYYYDDDWMKIDGFTIYGYEGSEAERYAKDNEFTFVPLKDKVDEATGIILAVPEDTDLTVKDITADISSDLPDGCNKMTAYDITLTKDGETVQPENTVTVKIPCTNEDTKVFRLEADGTMTDMNAKYKDGYMVFTTDHFSVYVLAEPEPAIVAVPGDVTGDGKTNVQDCTAILRYVRKLDTLSEDQLKLGDVTGDGKVNVQDVTRILRHVRKIEALYTA